MKFQLVSSKPRIFLSTSSTSTGLKFSFFVLSELAVNGTCPSITVTDVFPKRTLLLLLTIAPKPIAGQIPIRHIGGSTKCGVVGAGGVFEQRFEPDGGVELPRSVEHQCLDSTGRVGATRVLLKSANPPPTVLKLPVILLESAWYPMALLLTPVVLVRSAWNPVAVFSLPVVLLNSVLNPVAVLLLPVVLKTSA